MITRKLIACFDIRDGMVTKAHKFQDNIDILPAAEMARRMQADKIDGIVLYDIFASAEKRMIDLDPIRRVASEIDVPLLSAAEYAVLRICMLFWRQVPTK